ncbi:pilus assembly PilX family protein [Rivibacter subsaxonicus]|uniref:PilX-like prepilin protein n=1 Tax=Rivibacter subsaxonicus TaxID=457575 RepID=A0A4Q7VV47_9BURK|nr:PilX N-terminal domain-containing pilus assembly protein [Rivibacter subsaxonicus]RZU00524.1 PilX-like prepilin protein [Rivibacter subsaxonicus]
MLSTRQPSRLRAPRRARQQGIVLFIALIVLVAMTLAGIGLMRSVYTSNRIAGNLAFQQAATQAADLGIEAAVVWLENNAGATLHQNIDVGGGNPVGYAASRQDPAAGQSWNDFWTTVLDPARRVTTLAAPVAGNTVSYAIQRLCTGAGDPTDAALGISCEASPTAVSANRDLISKTGGTPPPNIPPPQYYRISVRVVGPRNTVSFVQAVVSI